MKKNLNSQITSLTGIEVFLNKIDVYVFIAESGTQNVLYINEKIQHAFGYGETDSLTCGDIISDFHGHTFDYGCYPHLTSAEDTPFVSIIYNDKAKQYYKHVASLIEFDESSVVCLHHITEIPFFTAPSEASYKHSHNITLSDINKINENSDIHNAHKLCEDETKRQLDEALEIIYEQNRKKIGFISSVSHELFTPLNAIKSMAHIAELSDDITKIKSYISTISNAATQLFDILTDIIDMAKFELGQIRLANLPFHLDHTLTTLCNVLMQEAKLQKQTISFIIEPAVPTRLRGDEIRLTQIIRNLLTSVMKYAPSESKIEIAVKTHSKATGSAVLHFQLAVINMNSDENHEYFYDIFQQLNSKEYKNYGETSLGLILCKEIIEAMTGDVWIGTINDNVICLNFTIQTILFELDDKIDECDLLEQNFIQYESNTAALVPSGSIRKNQQRYLPYIDIQEGLSSINDNEKLYVEMLKNFQTGTAFENLTNAIEEKNVVKTLRIYKMLTGVTQSLSLTQLHNELMLHGEQLKSGTTQKQALFAIKKIFDETNDKISELLSNE